VKSSTFKNADRVLAALVLGAVVGFLIVMWFTVRGEVLENRFVAAFFGLGLALVFLCHIVYIVALMIFVIALNKNSAPERRGELYFLWLLPSLFPLFGPLVTYYAIRKKMANLEARSNLA